MFHPTDGQDWEVVRFPSKRVQAQKMQARNQAMSTLERKAVRELAKDDPESLKLEGFESDFVQRILQARIARGMKQSDLARALHEDSGRIQRFEQRKETYCPKLKAKLQSWLQKNQTGESATYNK